ncbi:hypothetical protein DJ79_14680 [Halorubrum ezzemoulense]|uniref:Lipoprotein n=1 Tax=Halorubrum ezzemoulense TaxID=337243 RepID=A0A256JBK5_HALEZ|nr:hypothetical protein [Halorubrum ezzemoulense]OYR65717.1 hypothetical protein DJ79_14680 [Halorubrum ezzemoulense]
MADVPRRRVLLAAASGIAALAGCSGSETASNSYPVRSERRIEGYELETVRDERGGALVTAGEEASSLSAEERERQRRHTYRVLVSEDDLAALAFAETPAGETLRSFCAGTEFDAESVYLLSMPVGACRDVRLESVAVEPDDLAEGDLHPRADFCRAYRPADVECDSEATHTVGFAIRLPVAADSSTGSGRGMSSSCGRGEPPAVFNASDSPGTGGDSA